MTVKDVPVVARYHVTVFVVLVAVAVAVADVDDDVDEYLNMITQLLAWLVSLFRHC